MTDEKVASAEARLIEKHIEAVEKSVGENRRKSEQRFDSIDGRIEVLNKVMTDHAASDERQLKALNDSFSELLALLRIGRAAQTIGSFIRSIILYLGPFVVAAGVGYAYYLWLVGRGPFPHP